MIRLAGEEGCRTVQIAGSTRSLWEMSMPDACGQLQDPGFDKVELWINNQFDQLKVAQVTKDMETTITEFRAATRMSPVAVHLEDEISIADFEKMVLFCRELKISQLTIESSELGTPFNTEIDRLRERHSICHQSGVRLAILTSSGRLTEDPHTAVELCQSVAGLGITLDPATYVCRSGPAVDFDIVFGHVLHCHLRDASATERQISCGLGDVDFNRITTALHSLRYDRSLGIDLLPRTMAGEERLLELRKMRLLLESML